MSMHVYLHPELTKAHPTFTYKFVNLDEPSKTWDWSGCSLNGLKILWDGGKGLPYLEVRNFIAEPHVRLEELMPVTWSEREKRKDYFSLVPAEEWKNSPLTYISIVDHWTGFQPSSLLVGVSENEFSGCAVGTGCTALVTRRGKEVHLELTLTPPDPRLAWILYMAIRAMGTGETGQATDLFAEVSWLD